jgi:hypothetical protein
VTQVLRPIVERAVTAMRGDLVQGGANVMVAFGYWVIVPR